MGNLTLNNNDVTFVFRKVTEKDLGYIQETFGLENFQKIISNMNDIRGLSAALYEFMFQLLVKPQISSKDDFADKFGTSYRDVAKLYSHLNLCIGNSKKDVDKNLKLLAKNRNLTKENQSLKYQLMIEKAKNFKNLFS